MTTTAISTNITLPPGRLVQGSIYDPQTTDMQNKPLVVKNGPRAGQPTQRFYFAIAVPKGTENHWGHTEWGAKIWAFGHGALPQLATRPDFAWKIDDGDSATPNTAGRIPRDTEGFKGCWVVRLTSEFAPRCYVTPDDGKTWQQLLDKSQIAGTIKPGYWVEVAITLGANGDTRNPGVYLNHSMVALRGFGPEITFGPNVTSAGFGTAPLPVGASKIPVGQTFAPAPATPAAPAVPTAVGAGGRTMLPAAKGATYEALIAAGWTDQLLVQHGMMAPPTAAPAPIAPPPASAVPAVPVAPHPTILTPPAPGAVATPPPPGAAVHALLPKAAGATYEALVAAGWTDQLLVQHGMMAP